MRMVAAIAHMNGHDVRSEQVKTFIYSCLLGNEVKQALREAGLRVGKQLTRKAIHGMSREIIMKLNRVVGNKLVCKFGGRRVFGAGSCPSRRFV
jgi:hypothetical protein